MELQSTTPMLMDHAALAAESEIGMASLHMPLIVPGRQPVPAANVVAANPALVLPSSVHIAQNPLIGVAQTAKKTKGKKKDANPSASFMYGPNGEVLGPKIPRPPNAFILYRSDNQPKLVQNFVGQGKSSRDFSALIGQMWKDESPTVRDHYQSLAAERMKQHRMQYPEYKYRPSMKEEIDPVTGLPIPGTSVAVPSVATQKVKKDAKNKRFLEQDGDFDNSGLDADGKPKKLTTAAANKRNKKAATAAAAHAALINQASRDSLNPAHILMALGQVHDRVTPPATCSVISTPAISPSLSGIDHMHDNPSSSPFLSKKSGMPALLEYQEEIGFLRQKLRDLVEENEVCLKNYGIPSLSSTC